MLLLIKPLYLATVNRQIAASSQPLSELPTISIIFAILPLLLTELRIATSDEEMSLDKTEYSAKKLFTAYQLNVSCLN
jgi:hypothetical protein